MKQRCTMSDKRRQILENLKKITEKETTQTNFDSVYSNMGGDRIYQNSSHLELINKDMTRYKGKINKRSITCVDTSNNNFRSYVYETIDGRWFDRAGMPIKKPTNLVGKDDTGEEEPTDQTA